jgi:hypothetical protein
LNPEEKRCVRLLGFPPEDFRMDGTTDGQHGVDKTWDAMSDDERQCARLLGWDAAKWHRHDRVPQVTLWAELSDDERHAAVFLVREPWRCVAYACGPIFSRLYKRPALASSHTPAPLTADGRVCVRGCLLLQTVSLAGFHGCRLRTEARLRQALGRHEQAGTTCCSRARLELEVVGCRRRSRSQPAATHS